MMQTKAYKRDWMRKWRKEQRAVLRPGKLLKRGKCPICEMLLASSYHTQCRALSSSTLSVIIHAKLGIY